jgi:signal transduction histidine kinase
MSDMELEQALYREQQRAVELAYLYQIALELMGQPVASITNTTQAVLENMLILLNCRLSSILLWDNDDQVLMPVRSLGHDISQDTEWPPADFCREVWLHKRALVHNYEDAGSYLGVPLLVKDEPLGIIVAHRSFGRRPFGDDEIQLITLLASLTATMISNIRLQQFLNERLELLQTVMNSSPSGMIVVENGRLLMANPVALQSLRLYQTDFDLPLEVDGPDGLLLERLREADNDNPSFDYRVSGPDNEERHLQFTVVTVGPDRILAQMNDVTLLREVESRREQAVAYTSHELKTPLAVMTLGLSNLLSYYERMPDQERRQMIGEAMDQVNEMRGLITSLLDPARRPKKATGSAPIITASPLVIIQQAYHDLAPLAQINDIRMEWAAIENAPGVRCAPEEVKTIARNLISNAIKYTPQGGAIRVLVTTENETLKLLVQDNGVGIPKDEIPRIFEARYRASTRGQVEGNGLGLSIVREIIQRIRAEIRIESEVGKGTTFTVFFPIIKT